MLVGQSWSHGRGNGETLWLSLDLCDLLLLSLCLLLLVVVIVVTRMIGDGLRGYRLQSLLATLRALTIERV